MILRAVMFQAGWSTTGGATNNIETERRFGDDWFAQGRLRAVEYCAVFLISVWQPWHNQMLMSQTCYHHVH